MADPQKLRKIVSETVSARLEQLQDALIEEITEAVQDAVLAAEKKAAAAEDRASAAESALDDHKSQPKPSSDRLEAAMSSIASATGQADILNATLDGISQFAARTALYVHKGGQLTGWQARGFAGDTIKNSNLDPAKGLARRVMDERQPISAPAGEFNKEFVSSHGKPWDGKVTVLPLIVREKISALIYADAGTEKSRDADLPAVRMLVRGAAMALEILALRKSASVSAESDHPAAPVAGEAPQASAGAAVEPSPSRAPAGPDLGKLSKDDQETHNKAKRFAKLLVDEIKLYNQKKVDEGKQRRDLYQRLKEDIDKSRATYEKRFASTAAGSAEYFKTELVRILADNDASLMGTGF